MKILLVDDLDANLKLLELVLGSQGHRATLAMNGQEALAKARQDPPDLIISDILMPVMDGYALCRAWGEDPALRKIPFIFYTATYLTEEDEAFALSLGAAAFLRKPMEPEPFLAQVNRVLGRPLADTPTPVDVAIPDEGTFLKLYNERLVHKLDQRTQLLAKRVEELQQVEAMLRLKSVALEAAASELRQAQKMEAVGRLAGGVAHDFNNMLNVILINAELSLQATDLTPSQGKFVQEIKHAAERSADLTRQLLAFSRKQPALPRCIDLNQVVRENWKMLLRMIEGDIELDFRPAPALDPVFMDPSQITQMLTNLVINSRDALPGAGTISIETAKVQVEADSALIYEALTPGSYVRLTVSDTGTGMDAHTLEHLFEPFFTTKGEGRGTGLGLSTVYGIVKQNNGAISVYSNPGLGTSMKIYLPVCQEGESLQEPGPEAASPRGTETILVAEDEKPMLEVIRTVLEGMGYTVLAAASPLATVLLGSQHPGPIHLLITDVVMPGLNGKELQEYLTQARPGLKVLFMSGYTGDILAKRGLMREETQFLQKPFRMVDLARKVREVLDSCQPD